MPTFDQAAKAADASGLPVVEGFAVQLQGGADAATVETAIASKLNDQLPGYGWTVEPIMDGWRVCRPGGTAVDPPPPVPALDAAWEAVRALKGIPGVAGAEPLLLTRLPVANGSDAQRSFRLWGKVSDARLAQIQAASNDQHRHWSLLQMGVCDANGQTGAWATWKAKPGNAEKLPGDGVLVAHPDTGYTRHARLLPHLQPHADNPNLHGRNFVERQKPDGFDPMEDRSLGNFPGHGTGTASVIAAGGDPANEPWGIAPGAKILPLRVSSSVIHLSFQNVCDALVEAMDRGAHVISMSLGGPLGSDLLNSLVRQALDKGIIVVAAAGNYAPTVVFPARIPGVIACGACNALQAPWRFSGMGAEVAITAPGELVWHDSERVDGANGKPKDDRTNGSGTSFATANVAGLAALWLSYHGRDKLVQFYNNDPSLTPFAFRHCLQKSADPSPSFIRGGSGGFGKGIANAGALLNEALPNPDDVAKERNEILSHAAGGVGFPVNTWWTILTLPTLTADEPRISTQSDADARQERIERLVKEIVGPASDEEDAKEIGAIASTDADLQDGLERAGRGEWGCASADAVRRHLLDARKPLSPTLKQKLEDQRKARRLVWQAKHARLISPSPVPDPNPEPQGPDPVSAPTERRLRAFAFDPSLATRSDTAAINEITIPILFERELKPGPVGEYLEVVDVDPASDCVYAPVDLNHPFLLAQNGLAPSDGNPQFHQQMVYAVAMKTIRHFEEGLGRPIFWSPLRPWNRGSGDRERAVERPPKNGRPDLSDQFVQRLRLYPHALRAENAYYSPQKRAILFGYFPAGDSDPGTELPGGMIFSCLSHDIIAHETTHAIVDGMHVYFTEPTNPDVFAFHEAFADIVALFQHFTYPELLRDQIARARGDLGTGTLLTQLATQFGQATGQHQALRDALGAMVYQQRTRGESEWRDQREDREMEPDASRDVTILEAARSLGGEEARRVWKRYVADPSLLAQVEEPHARGALLVAAVFDAYLKIYEGRVADLKRIATGGTGVLPDGQLHPDLVNRMAGEAAKCAGHVLRMCIRAMDYVPPVDITYGEFLRALITADYDLVPSDPRRYRVAFIEAFRKWGIYPRDVRTLSEESLRWRGPDQATYLFPNVDDDLQAKGDPEETQKTRELTRLARDVRRALLAWEPGKSEPGKSRESVFAHIGKAQAAINQYLWFLPEVTEEAPDPARVAKRLLARVIQEGLDIPPFAERGNAINRFSVANLRPARRIGPNGEFLTEMVVEIVQTRRNTGNAAGAAPAMDTGVPFRGGVTLIISMDDWRIRYAIRKNIDSVPRQVLQGEYALRAAAGGGGAAEYSSQAPPDLVADHDAWMKDRVRDREAMRISSCNCRGAERAGAAAPIAAGTARKRGDIPPAANALVEPFAMLHQS